MAGLLKKYVNILKTNKNLNKHIPVPLKKKKKWKKKPPQKSCPPKFRDLKSNVDKQSWDGEFTLPSFTSNSSQTFMFLNTQ